MAAARYWRLVGVESYAGGDLELSALHWYESGGARLDSGSTLSSSHSPITGALAALRDADAATSVRFAGAAVRSSGFYLMWDFGAAVEVVYPRLGGGAAREMFLGWATLQYSTDEMVWTTAISFGQVIWPGVGQLTSATPDFNRELPSEWDVASKGTTASITGRDARVWSNFTGIVRSNAPRSTGRRVFGLRLTVVAPPQTFFGGLAALSGWGSYNTGKHWSPYGTDGFFWAYPAGTRINLSPEPGAPTAVGDTMYFDVNLGTGYCALKKNGGAWSAQVPLPGFNVGAEYVIDLLSPSTSGDAMGALLLTSAADLSGSIPSGASAWDAAGGEPFASAVIRAPSASDALCAASASVGMHRTPSAAALELARDIEFGGPGRVWGTTKTKGTPNLPTKARVVLQHQRSKLPVRETWSDPVTGFFVFDGIDTRQEFITLAEHAAGLFLPVAANKLVPEVVS